ncbi:MAG: acetate--CoA ligase [Bacteroidia bacterium]|nr:acetate--CoA ligase [Bacteroidia bacterium]
MAGIHIRNIEDYNEAYALSINNPEKFWEDIASEFQWKKPWTKTLEWNFIEPKIKWFEGGVLNITENCLDRHLESAADKLALIWEPNEIEGSTLKYTYSGLHKEVCRMANVLKELGVKKGDRICIYMPMVPELTFALLACARIGAIHCVIFAGFSADSIAGRINDCGCSVVITSESMSRGNKKIALKTIIDEAIDQCQTVEKVLVFADTKSTVQLKKNRDYLYIDLASNASDVCPAEPMDAEDPLFILYTSGSTGKPKGVVHTCGGYMVYAGYTFANVFQYKHPEIFWCTADIGWVTGHTYSLYGPLLNGATTLIFEGIPTYPAPDRFWKIIEKHKVNIFYTAPTAIRSLMCEGTEIIEPYDLSSLKVLGSVGEPINEEAWHWYNENIGNSDCPLTDTWWQTETGGIMIASIAGITPSVPAHAGLPLPGIQPVLLDADGKELEGNDVEGYLAIKFPWPGILRTTWGDHERCRLNYFDTFKGYYFSGDGAKRTAEGLYRIIGRVDDVINVSGHRFGTAEIENAINESAHIIESAVVGYPHDIKGQGIYAFVIASSKDSDPELLKKEAEEMVMKYIGKIARLDKIQVVSGLPKTRSGKIMRRILRKIAEGEINNLGDTSTLLDPGVVDLIIKGVV